MMAVLCCSIDSSFQQLLRGHFADGGIVFRPSVEKITAADLKTCEAVLIDLKDTVLPQDCKLPDLPVLALAEVPSFQEAMLLLQRGVRGYGNRHMRQENLSQALKSLQAGQLWLPPDIVGMLIGAVRPVLGGQPKEKNFTVELSAREREVAGYVAKGMSNQEIADIMFVAVRTVKAHLSSIYEKTGFRNRLELGLRMREQD